MAYNDYRKKLNAPAWLPDTLISIFMKWNDNETDVSMVHFSEIRDTGAQISQLEGGKVRENNVILRQMFVLWIKMRALILNLQFKWRNLHWRNYFDIFGVFTHNTETLKQITNEKFSSVKVITQLNDNMLSLSKHLSTLLRLRIFHSFFILTAPRLRPVVFITCPEKCLSL